MQKIKAIAHFKVEREIEVAEVTVPYLVLV